MFSLSPIYSARKSSNHKLSKKHKISPDTNLQKTYTNIKHKIFEELVPSVLPLLQRAHNARTRCYRIVHNKAYTFCFQTNFDFSHYAHQRYSDVMVY